MKDVLLLDVIPADAGHRNGWRRGDPDDPAQHHGAHAQVADFLDLTATTSRAWRSRCSRANARLSRDNKNLGTFHLDGIPPSPRGTPQIEVTFDIDANGILNVSAKDLGTGKEQKISITGSSGLTKEEIERMRKEAEAHADEDNKAKEAIETRNQADNLAYQCEKQLKDLGDKLPADKKAGIEEAIAGVRKALEGTDTDAIKTARETCKPVSRKSAPTFTSRPRLPPSPNRAGGARTPGGPPSRRGGS